MIKLESHSSYSSASYPEATGLSFSKNNVTGFPGNQTARLSENREFENGVPSK